MVSKTINLKDIREEAFEKGKAEGRRELLKEMRERLTKLRRVHAGLSKINLFLIEFELKEEEKPEVKA